MIFYGLGLLAGDRSSTGQAAGWVNIFLVTLSFAFFWSSCYLLNDICDQSSDIENDLNRPLAKGRATRKQFFSLFTVTSFFGFFTSRFLESTISILLLLCWILGVLYSLPRIGLKRLPILSLVPSATAFGLLVFIGSYLREGPSDTTISISAIVMALILLAGNAKDLGDVAGDSATGRLTLPMLIGPRATAWMTVVASSVVGIFAIRSYLVLELGQCFLLLSSMGVFTLVVGSLVLVRLKSPRPPSVRRRNLIQSFGAMLVIIAYIVGCPQ